MKGVALRPSPEWPVGSDAGTRAFPLSTPSPCSILAVGGESKSAVCFLRGRNAILSAPIGNLTDPPTYREFVATIERLKRRFQFVPDVIAHDSHPLYLSTAYAVAGGLPTLPVQHHHAHLAAVAAERRVDSPAIGVCCDGLGFGTDGAIWGCEIMRFDTQSFMRCETLDPFPLFGGDLSAIQTWRPAASLLRMAFGAGWRKRFRAIQTLKRKTGPHPTDEELNSAERLMDRGLTIVKSSSLGRVFDAVSFLLGLCEENQHEGQAAVALEAAAVNEEVLPYPIQRFARPDVTVMSVAPMIREVVQDLIRGIPPGVIAARYHQTIAHMIAAAVLSSVTRLSLHSVVLGGGCFSNQLLRSKLTRELTRKGLTVTCPQQTPFGDAGLALGQAVIASHTFRPEASVKMDRSPE